MATVNAEVQKKPNENSQNLIRRFTRRVQGTGLVRRVRSVRYAERNKSPYVITIECSYEEFGKFSIIGVYRRPSVQNAKQRVQGKRFSN